MNKIFRFCVSNQSKSVLRVLANQGSLRCSLSTSTIKPILSIRPLTASTNVLLNFDRRLNTFGRAPQEGRFKRRQFDDDEDLMPEENRDEPSSSPKAHNIHSDSYKGAKRFEDYNLPESLLKRMKELGFEAPFPIQSETFPHTLAGKDLIGKAITGSGKTLAFSVPIVLKVLNSKNKDTRYPKCLVLSPTRELCQQIQRSIKELAPALRCVAIYGGGGMREQIDALSRGCDIVCATPGRLRDLLERRNFNKDFLELICLDEADQLLKPEFLDQIKFVLEGEHEAKQMLMFSATMSHSVNGIVRQYMKDPIFVDLTDGDDSARLPANVKHFSVKVSKNIFADAAHHFINEYKSERSIIFTNQKITATYLSQDLLNMGIKAADLHSDHSQTKREQRLRLFRKGSIKVLVATDVAARGIDVPEVDMVIQAGLPVNGSDFYIHRSGRTGRAGRPGISISFLDGDRNEYSILRDIQRLTKVEPLQLPADLASKVQTYGGGGGGRGGFDRPGSSYSRNNDSFGSQRRPSFRRDSYGDEDGGRFDGGGSRFNRSDRSGEDRGGFRPSRFGGDRDRGFRPSGGASRFTSNNTDNDRLNRLRKLEEDDDGEDFSSKRRPTSTRKTEDHSDDEFDSRPATSKKY